MKRRPDVQAIRARIEAATKAKREANLIRPERYPSTPGLKRYEADRVMFHAFNIRPKP